MATNRWIGTAAAVAQVSTVTITADDVNTTYKITCNGKVVSVVGSGTGVNNTATNLQAALIASSFPEFTEITWTVATNVVTGTAATPGKPFTVTSSVSGGTGTIGAVSTTSGTGPNDLSVGANWSLGVVPVTGDDIYFEGSSIPDALYNLSTLAAVTPNSINVSASFTGSIGLPQWTGSYFEYRPQYLQVTGASSQIQIGYGQGPGSGRIKLDTTTGSTTLLIYGTAQATEFNSQAVRWKGTNGANTVQVTRGSLGIAMAPGETATISTLDIGYQQNVLGDAQVMVGSGTTVTSIYQSGGVATIFCAIGNIISMIGGQMTVAGNATAIVNVVVDAGVLYYNTTGTLTSLIVGNAGTVNFNQDLRGKTVTNCTVYKGASLIDSFIDVVWTNPILFAHCRYGEVNLDLGVNRNLKPS